MAVELKGGTGSTPVPANSRLRATWRWVLGGIANPLINIGFDAPDIASQMQDALPSQGFVPISNPTAKPGDEVILFNVRVGAGNATATMSQVASKLDATPVSSLLGGRIVELTTLELLAVPTVDKATGATVYKSPTGGTAPTTQEMNAGLDSEQKTQQQKANDSNLVDDTKKAVKSIFEEIKDILGAAAPVLGILVVGGIAYLVYKYKKG